jgi:hypothetical protein
MAERVKLEQPGEEIILRIGKVTKENVQNTDYFLFTNGNKELLVPVSSVSRQLANMEITDVQTLVGKTIKLARSTKLSRYGKPFWDLSLATEAEAKTASVASAGSPPANAGAAGAPAPSPMTEDQIRDAKAKHARGMKEAVDYTLRNILPLYTNAKVEVNGDVIYKHAFSIYNKWEDRGLLQ